VIRKTSKGWIVVSESGRRMGGPYKTLKEAKTRLSQVEMFKHMKDKSTIRKK
jgi:hypothetical protein